MKHSTLAVILLLASSWLTACTPKKVIPGTRLSVFDLDKKLRVVSSKNAPKIILPAARTNRDWAQVGLEPTHQPQHLALGKNIKVARRISIGKRNNTPFAFAPLIARGKAFLLNRDNLLQAFDLKSGTLLWKVDFYEEGTFGGSLAYDKGRLFISTGAGVLAAVASANGDILWRKDTGLVYRAAPVVWQGNVFFMSFNNVLTLRDGFSGKEIWSHNGISEPSSLLMSSAVAVSKNIVVVPYNSGEVFALQAANKQFIWTDNLLRQGLGPGSNVGFVAVPVVDKNIVYMISNADYLVAADLTTGERRWTQHISGINMPWLAGKQLFVLSQEGWLLCLDKRTGLVLWRTLLKGEGVWYGPVLAGERLWLTSSNGNLVEVSAFNGNVLSTRALSDGFRTAPVVAGGRMFLLSKEMELLELVGE